MKGLIFIYKLVSDQSE